MGKPLRDLTDQRFGLLVVLRIGQKQRLSSSGAWWLCQCDCGREKSLPSRDLVAGKIRSCGCRHEAFKNAGRVTHGQSKGNRTYRIWQAMLTRCRNPNTPGWEIYGGRGIEVCDRWSVFENFLADMGYAPNDRSIDRIDNDGDYGPQNCRWAIRSEQANNTRVNVRIAYAGETLTRSQWERRLGLKKTTLRGRLRRGLSLAEAMRPAWLAEGNTPTPYTPPPAPEAQ